MRPEAELLLCCAQPIVNDTIIQRIRDLVTSGMDEESLLNIASYNGMIPLLYRGLNTHAPEIIPATLHNKLTKEFYLIVNANIILTKELLHLLDVFDSHGIPATPIKGPVLAAYLYGSTVMRQCRDLDILVSQQDYPRVRSLMLEQGYRPEYPVTGSRQEQALLRFGYHLSFVNTKKQIAVEIHWKVMSDYHFPDASAAVSGDRQQVSLYGVEVPVFMPEDLLLYLCAHGAKDSWERFEWVCSLAVLLNKERQMDWERILHHADRLRCRRRLLLGLALADVVWQSPHPEQIKRAMQNDPRLKVLVGQIFAKCFANRRFDFVKRDSFQFQLRECWADRIRYYFEVLTEPTVVELTQGLPQNLFFLYRAMRFAHSTQARTKATVKHFQKLFKL